MQTPSIGRIVHYVLAMSGDKPIVRPAIVVHVWDTTPIMLNLQIFTDGDNDDPYLRPSERSGRDSTPGKATRCIVWRTSIVECSADAPLVGHWFWPPRV
jgi:hypothetical protein